MTTTDYAEELAREMVGNHRRFARFAWFERPRDAENWALVYTHNRDSGLLDQSNAAQIEEALETFSEDVRFESHSHWAVGHVDGFSIRVYRDGQITEAFLKYAELRERLEDYPILDDEDYSRREYEATVANVTEVGHRFVVDGAPEDWPEEVFSWLWDHGNALENRDDQGGYPSDEEMRDALAALGWLHPDYCED
jgi:hypothetical protein